MQGLPMLYTKSSVGLTVSTSSVDCWWRPAQLCEAQMLGPVLGWTACNSSSGLVPVKCARKL